MSNNEKIFEQWLIDNNIEYEYQPIIENVTFTKSRKYKADFKVYNRDKSEYIIIEIKGFMTYEAVNKLKYLVINHPENFFIFQMTEKDWMHLPIKDSINTQFSILMSFIENGHAEKLNKSSCELLYKYINCKNMEYIKYSSPYFEYRDLNIPNINEILEKYINDTIKDLYFNDIANYYKGRKIPAGILTTDECPIDISSVKILLKQMILDLIFEDHYKNCDGPDTYLEFPDLEGLFINRTENIISIYYGYMLYFEFSITPNDVFKQ